MASDSSNNVWIDRDAAGIGWSTGNYDGYDLLSAVTHEFGHMLGLDHDVMGDRLNVSERSVQELGTLAVMSMGTAS